MIRINLQNAGAKKQRRKAAAVDTDGGGPSQLLPAMMLALPLAAGGGGSYFVHASLVGQIQDTRGAIQRGEMELARLKPILDEINQFKKDKALLESKLEAIRALEHARTGPVEVYAELAALMPPQVWVLGVRESGGNAVLDGIGLDSQSIAVFVNAMGRSQYFSDVELTAVEQAQYLGLTVKRFNVSCRFRKPSAPRVIEAAAPGTGRAAGSK